MLMSRSKELVLTLAVTLCACSFAFAADKPNIVLILSDDQAWTDYGFMGHPRIQTPHLDALAERSLVFDRGYVASPLCRPSLASMVTGLYPFQHGTRPPVQPQGRPARKARSGRGASGDRGTTPASD